MTNTTLEKITKACLSTVAAFTLGSGLTACLPEEDNASSVNTYQDGTGYSSNGMLHLFDQGQEYKFPINEYGFPTHNGEAFQISDGLLSPVGFGMILPSDATPYGVPILLMTDTRSYELNINPVTGEEESSIGSWTGRLIPLSGDFEESSFAIATADREGELLIGGESFPIYFPSIWAYYDVYDDGITESLYDVKRLDNTPLFEHPLDR